MQQRKIPTIVGLLLVFAVMIAFRFAFERISPYFAKASTTDEPKDVVVTNTSDTGFSVTWLTTKNAIGAISIDEKKELGTIFDERDTFGDAKSKLPGSYKTHSVSVHGLSPDTTYNVRIVSNGKTFLKNGQPYQARTGPILSGSNSTLEPAYGQVSYPSGQPASGSLVYLKPEGGQTLSTIVTATGSWVIPMNVIRTEDGGGFLEVSDRLNESIIIRSSEGDSSAETDTINDNPVPDMTIGKTYDFRKIQAELKPNQQLAIAPTPLPTAYPTSAPKILGTTTTSHVVVAISKPSNGSSVTSTLPLIQGTGIPGTSVLILLGIQRPVTGTVTVGTDGVWYYTPSKPLSEGKQSVTITTKDKTGKTVAITHAFDILKSGTQVLGDATPSAVLTPTPTPLLIDPIDATATPTPTDSLEGDPVPVTGSPLPLMILLGLGTVLMLSGAVLFIL